MTTKKQFKPVDEQIAYLRKGAAEIIREEDLRAKLDASAKTGNTPSFCESSNIFRTSATQQFFWSEISRRWSATPPANPRRARL